MRLSDLKAGESAVVIKVLGHGAFRKRIMEMGFVHGKKVSAILNAPLRDPVKYKIMDYEVSLRRSEAAMIEVMTQQEAEKTVSQRDRDIKDRVPEESLKSESLADDPLKRAVHRSGKTITIALVGNPNSGKTSLFNAASGAHEHVGNYGGVTVDVKRGSFSHKGYRLVIYDLPGTYALSAYTPEELYVRRFIMEQTPDVVVNVVAASNLERNLYLTTELIDMDLSMVIALNMYDELEQRGSSLDHVALGGMIGVPIVPTVSRGRHDLRELFDTVIRVHRHKEPTVRHIHIALGQETEAGITALKEEIRNGQTAVRQFSPRYLAIKLLEGDREMEHILGTEPGYGKWIEIRDSEKQRIERTLGKDIETAMADRKYGFISGALKETFTPGEKEELQTTRIIDSFVTHKLWGFPIFLLIMWLMFQATFTLGLHPMEWIEGAVGRLGGFVGENMGGGALKDLIVDGVIGGVGGVIVFLPNILILYLFISFMEDSGYMARAAFIMDRIMHRIGLHGKSFIPLVMGFGCNVPAIMATRTIESRSSRLITMLINPFMSCSARLPIYILLVGTFFPMYGSLVFTGLYLLGILVAVITARLMRRFLFRKDETPFVMELPPYRMPAAKSILIHMWEKAWQYLRKMGGIILAASVAVWFLSYYPRPEKEPAMTTPAAAGTMVTADGAAPPETGLKDSYIGRIGRFCEPAVRPLGFNWKISVALLTGTAAKELVVSTLGVLYAENDTNDTSVLSQKLKAPDPSAGKPDLTPLTALALLVFVLLYFPCLASIVAIAKESGSWKWALFSFLYNTSLAWAMAWLVYNIGGLFL